MSDDYKVMKSTEAGAPADNQASQNQNRGEKVIDEANYKIRGPRENGPSAIGRGGDPLFRRIKATREQLIELVEETGVVQDWVEREKSNNAALSCLEEADLKDAYFNIKDGFSSEGKSYGKIALMGFKTPCGVEIPRLKIYDTNGDVLEVISGPMAIDEIRTRALAYQNSVNSYEAVEIAEEISEETGVIEDYNGSPENYLT